MALHTLALTDVLELALLFDTEQANARQAGQVDADGQPLAALTMEDVLVQGIAQHLTNQLRNLDAQAQSLLALVDNPDPAAVQAILGTFKSAALRMRVEALLASV